MGAPGRVCRGLGVSQGLREAVATFELLRKDPIWWPHGEGLVPVSSVGRHPVSTQRDTHSRSLHCPSSGGGRGVNGQKHRPVSSWMCCSRPEIRCSTIQTPFSVSSIPPCILIPHHVNTLPSGRNPNFCSCPFQSCPQSRTLSFLNLPSDASPFTIPTPRPHVWMSESNKHHFCLSSLKACCSDEDRLLFVWFFNQNSPLGLLRVPAPSMGSEVPTRQSRWHP